MNKIGLIAKREFSSRVKKKSFLIMTLLGPILFGAIMVVPIWLATQGEDTKHVLVLDKTGVWNFQDYRNKQLGKTNDTVNNIFTSTLPPETTLENAKEMYLNDDGYYALLYIPKSESDKPDLQYSLNLSKLYGRKDISISVQRYLERRIEKSASELILLEAGVTYDKIKESKIDISVNTISLESGDEKASATPIKMAVGYIAGFAIYLFIFLYGAQIMRGVIEEKSNRIVEVIISSVKPFQLMMGKIVGICGVAILQIVIWVALSAVISSVINGVYFSEGFSPEVLAQSQASGADLSGAQEAFLAFQSIPFGLIIPAFIFFFIGGYMLYGSFFAAIGSAADSETDTQQFMLPITIPLIVAIMVARRVIEDPASPMAFWVSIIPLTSPIVMMVRLPFIGLTPDLFISMALLVVFFIFSTWVAARIYRVGILMYGKKVNYKELMKWIRYKG
jgi:ABC-2 type transport system permease protein